MFVVVSVSFGHITGSSCHPYHRARTASTTPYIYASQRVSVHITPHQHQQALLSTTACFLEKNPDHI